MLQSLSQHDNNDTNLQRFGVHHHCIQVHCDNFGSSSSSSALSSPVQSKRFRIQFGTDTNFPVTFKHEKHF